MTPYEFVYIPELKSDFNYELKERKVNSLKNKYRQVFFVERADAPKIAVESGVKGVVWLKYRLSVLGKPEDVRLVRGVGYSCDQFAIEKIKNQPQYKLPIINGIPTEIELDAYVEFDFSN